MFENSEQSVTQAIAIAAKTDGTANGTGVDTAGYNRVTVLFDVGTRTDGTSTPKVQESADNSSFSDVAAADLDGDTLAALTSDTQQTVRYIGSSRYIRPVITTTGSTSGVIAGAKVLREGPWGG